MNWRGLLLEETDSMMEESQQDDRANLRGEESTWHAQELSEDASLFRVLAKANRACAGGRPHCTVQRGFRRVSFTCA